ncbi:hypothetical protein EMPG_09559 [Blastomyces silverae]|uniref:SRR1-like domain-containing protein n=1 Tax=Blastomyces silverae TaxID=2060906 RepID=A0A0H1BSK9_9EURO|nr:hypothetical protein EMPG_09559 [Blastomyces silverae]
MTDASDTTPEPVGVVWETITDEALDKVRSEAVFRYYNCIPIFTKDAIRDFGQQFEMAVAGQASVVSVRRLYGETVDFPVLSAHPYFPDSKPVIGFAPIQSLAGLGVYDDESYPTLTTHLHVEYHSVVRDKATGEVIPNIDIQPIENVEAYFKRTLTKWEATPACQHLRASLKALLQRNSNMRKIDKIVAYACGSLVDFETEESGDYPSLARHSFYQHALVITLLEILQNERTDRDAGQKIRCYLQDPIYTNAERDMLAKFDLTVVDGQEGFLLTDDSTAVLSFAPNVCVKQIVLDISLPSMMIWCKVKDGDLLKTWTDPDSPRIRKLIGEHYDAVEFQDYEQRFQTAFYVKRAPT